MLYGLLVWKSAQQKSINEIVHPTETDRDPIAHLLKTVLIPRIISVVRYNSAYKETWTYSCWTSNSLVKLSHQLIKSLDQLIVDGTFDVQVDVVARKLRIVVEKPSAFTVMQANRWKATSENPMKAW